jgi:zinc protease
VNFIPRWPSQVLRSGVFALAALMLALPMPSAQATDVERVRSPGGIEAWIVREASVPLITMEFAFLGGASQDAADKAGTANMVAQLLDEGAGDLDAKAFQQRLEERAIELNFNVGRDYFRGTLRTLTDNQEQAFDLLRLALNSPRFDPDPIERVRTQVMSGLRRETTSPNSLSSRRWWETAFPGHPYGRQVSGTLESVPIIAADDLKAYPRRVFAREHLKVAVVGNVDAATVGALLDRVFGALPAKAELQPVGPASVRGLGRREVIPLDVPQAVVTFGGPGIARSDPDFIPAYVVNHILGGGSFSSRLYREIREQRGLAYSVHASLVWLRGAALFMGGTATRADRTGETLDLIDKEIRRLADEGPTEDELAKAKAYLKGSYALNLDTSAKIASQLVQIQIDELGIDYISRRNALIDAVTLADARRVAKRLLGDGLLTTVVGRPPGVTAKEAN